MNLTEDQEKELDEMAKRFSATLGEGARKDTGSSGNPKETKGGG